MTGTHAPTVLRVAAVQVESHDGQVAANLARATPLVAAAASAGARLVVCPEFLAAGYCYEESIWDAAETAGGPTEAWLRQLALDHRIYLGASYLEADGDDFYNTFTLFGPDGAVAGRVRKESLPGFEGWFFKSCDGPKVIDTGLGRIAVGICQDNHTARFFRRLRDDDFDLLLMPHSAPGFPFGHALMVEALRETPVFYARSFGVPAILVNKARTRTRTRTPLPGLALRFDFPGLSSIVDGAGRRVAALDHREGFIVGEVTLDPSRKRRPPAPRHFYWSRPPRRFGHLTGALFALLERLAGSAYTRSARRPLAAHRASRPGQAIVDQER